MRHTVRLDGDVEAAIADECLRSGKSFKEVINTVLRQGLVVGAATRSAPPPMIRPVAMGLKPGLSLISVSKLESLTEEESIARLATAAQAPS